MKCISQPVSIKHFCLKNSFFASLEDTKGLAMINRAAMPPQIAVKPSYHHSFYQSFDGPEPIPIMANMPLDDIIISN
jgi:hypothetical protein